MKRRSFITGLLATIPAAIISLPAFAAASQAKSDYILLNYSKMFQELKHLGVNVFHQPRENYTFHSSDSHMNDVMANYLWGTKPEKSKAQSRGLQRLRNSKGRR